MIDVEVARTFLEVADTGSFQLAAQKLNVTQSTVSARIRTLEDRLGRKVFERSRAGAVLTSHGRAFQRFAQAIVQAWEDGRRIAAEGSSPRDRLRIGAEHNLWTRLLAPWLLELTTQLPELQVTASAADADAVTRSLLRGELDLAITHQAPAQADLQIERLMDDELILVTSDPDGRFTDRYIDVRWSARGAPVAAPESRTSIDLGLASMNYLMLSQSAGYVPRRLAGPYLAAGYLFPAESTPALPWPLYALHAKNEKAGVVERSLAILRDTISSPPDDKLKNFANAFRIWRDDG